MKKVFLLLAVITLIVSNLHAQTTFKLNHYYTIYNQVYTPVMSLSAQQSLNSRWALTSYFYVNASSKSSWGQGLVGPTFYPVKGLGIGFLGGFQSNEKEIWRISPLVTANYDWFNLFGAFEFGGERQRWDVIALCKTGPFRVGAEMIKYFKMYATGPRVELVLFKKQPVHFFYSAMWDVTNDKYTGMFGLHSTFGRK